MKISNWLASNIEKTAKCNYMDLTMLFKLDWIVLKSVKCSICRTHENYDKRLDTIIQIIG